MGAPGSRSSRASGGRHELRSHDPLPGRSSCGTIAIRGSARPRARPRSPERRRRRRPPSSGHAPCHPRDELAEQSSVIEAAPESLELKQDLFGQLEDGVVRDTAALATNTSSLLVTAVASKLTTPSASSGCTSSTRRR